MKSRDNLLRIERRLMAAEYWLDSTNTHVRRTKCICVRPLALERYSQGLNAIRSAIQLIRAQQGARHPTLFAGSAKKGKTWKRKQKAWGSNRWMKDCKTTIPNEIVRLMEIPWHRSKSQPNEIVRLMEIPWHRSKSQR